MDRDVYARSSTAGEMMSVAEPFLQQNMHPTLIISAYRQAMDDMLDILKEKVSIPVDVENREEMLKIIGTSVGTKFINKWYVYSPAKKFDSHCQTPDAVDTSRWCQCQLMFTIGGTKPPGGLNHQWLAAKHLELSVASHQTP